MAKREDAPDENGLRILAVCNIRHGGNDYSFVRAFRRAGHSVLVMPPESFLPRWENKWLKALRRLALPAMIADYNRAISIAAENFQPDLFFAFKGDSVTPTTVKTLRSQGAVTINFYPDTAFDGCSSQSISFYDWVFTTKPAQIELLDLRYGYTNASFVTHPYDPEVHAPPEMSLRDWQRYGCDVVFIGNISRKKEDLIAHLLQALPDISFKIWGAAGWRQARTEVRNVYQGGDVWGQEYAKAINGAKINLGLLYEGAGEAPVGDVITARTFEIPASGGFMLHEKTKEAMQYFVGNQECVFFANVDELTAKTRHFLSCCDDRQTIAAAGRRRAITSGYSYDDRVATIIAKYRELRTA